jgi:hypothetical protein
MKIKQLLPADGWTVNIPIKLKAHVRGYSSEEAKVIESEGMQSLPVIAWALLEDGTVQLLVFDRTTKKPVLVSKLGKDTKIGYEKG